MGEQKPAGKPFEIPKQEVWDAWLKVKANGGAPGADGQSIEDFGAGLKNNLFKVWNRMSSGSYFPPPVKAVEIPKAHGAGTRILGVPTVADRVAQTVVAARLEKEVEPKFHDDSYGYRPGRSALDAVGRCRERCWKHDWGGRSGHPEILRQRSVGFHRQSGGGQYCRCLGHSVCEAVAFGPAADARRQPRGKGPRNPARVCGFTGTR